MIVLDTSVLSVAFRRQAGPKDTGELLRNLVREDAPVAVPGIVLQEFLSGIRSNDQFERLRNAMAGFPTLTADRDLHVLAARLSNSCRKAGVSASTIDCLIAAQTIAGRGELFTLDRDFTDIAQHTGLKVWAVR